MKGKMSNGDAQTASGIAAYRTARELGSRSPRSYAAIREPNELVVLYRFSRSTDAKAARASTIVTPDGGNALGEDAMTTLLRDARCLAKHWHPNVARVRHVDFQGDDLVVATELVDGATLGDLFAAAAARRAPPTNDATNGPLLPLPILVRILVDVTAGLSGLHGLRGEDGAPLGAIHGALCPANIAVGKDGVARTLNALRPRPACMAVDSEVISYAAPEALDETATQDLRADVHALGVIMWEALTGRRLYEERDPARVLARQREEEIAPPALPAGSPFADLAGVAMRAMAFDASLRFKSAAEMGAALRAIAATHIAKGSAVAAWVADLAGDRIRARRIELDPNASSARRLAVERASRGAKAPTSSARRLAAARSDASERPRRDTLPPETLDPSELGPPSSQAPEETLRDAIPLTATVPEFVPVRASPTAAPASPSADVAADKPVATAARPPPPIASAKPPPPTAIAKPPPPTAIAKAVAVAKPPPPIASAKPPPPPPGAEASLPSVVVAPDSQPALREVTVAAPVQSVPPVSSLAPDAYGPMVHPTPDAAGTPVASGPPRDRPRVAAIAAGCLLAGVIVIGLFALRAPDTEDPTRSASAGVANATPNITAQPNESAEAEPASKNAEANARDEAKADDETNAPKTEPPADEPPLTPGTPTPLAASVTTTPAHGTAPTATATATAERAPIAKPKPAARPKRPTYEPLGI